MKYITNNSFLILIILNSINIADLNAQDSLPVDLTGEWQITNETPRGNQSGDMSITQDGDIAYAKTKQGSTEITISDYEVSWSIIRETRQGEMRANYTGIIESNDKMSGTFQVPDSPMGNKSMKWSAVRISNQVGEEE